MQATSLEQAIKNYKEIWEARRKRMARQAEAAANMTGNYEAPDFEEFLSKYSRRGKTSDFA